MLVTCLSFYYLFFYRPSSAMNRWSSTDVLLDHWAPSVWGPSQRPFSLLHPAGLKPRQVHSGHYICSNASQYQWRIQDFDQTNGRGGGGGALMNFF